MENSLQKKAFITYEADAWFDRNRDYLTHYSTDNDKVTNLLKDYSLKPKSLLEIGCAAGYRLNGIKSIFDECNVYGLEPSSKAIDYGVNNFPKVKFQQGTADNLEAYDNESMDVVIVGFVFYVIDRNIVFRVVSEIDRVLKNGGILIIVDFFSESSLKNEYQHIKDFSAYSFKQNYDEIFTSSKLYYLLDKSTLNHGTKLLDASEDYFNKYSITMLKKDINASYK
jgi:ubiquinone/menaquinone biosynthesis C-methylase UbiE